MGNQVQLVFQTPTVSTLLPLSSLLVFSFLLLFSSHRSSSQAVESPIDFNPPPPPPLPPPATLSSHPSLHPSLSPQQTNPATPNIPPKRPTPPQPRRTTNPLPHGCDCDCDCDWDCGRALVSAALKNGDASSSLSCSSSGDTESSRNGDVVADEEARNGDVDGAVDGPRRGDVTCEPSPEIAAEAPSVRCCCCGSGPTVV